MASSTMWLGFAAGVFVLLTLDLLTAPKGAATPTLRRSLGSCAVWIGLALAFALGLYVRFGRQPALEFLTGYCIEEALSIDNLFVFLLIFERFKVPVGLQPRVLRWGIFGALAMRALFIVLGAALLERFHWVFYLLGAFLVVTAVRLLRHANHDDNTEQDGATHMLLRLCPWPTTDGLRGGAFFVRENGQRMVTPLALALCVVELSDVLFALDSVPAIFAITTEPFIVYTSNVFAIMGLRAMYFLLAGMLAHFRYLKVGLGLILGFVGGKMLLHGIAPISAGASLTVVLGILALSILASWATGRTAGPKGAA